MIHISGNIDRLMQKAARLGLALCVAFAPALQTAAQSSKPGITVGGVYGGGQNGQINTSGNDSDSNAASVTVNSGTIANVWGGGEKGDTKGGTSVTLRGGRIQGSVFGGARQADISGGTSVNIDGANNCRNLTVGNVYGGNDVSGVISGTAIVTSTAQGASNDSIIYIGNLYGGGNGDYDYTSGTYQGLLAPVIANTSVSLLTGTYGNVYGGGNSATVTGSASLTLNNSSTVLKDSLGNVLTHQFGNVFGGNNKVPMAIRPSWNLTKASVENLYSGGNRGAMTYPNGIALIINSADMTVHNVFGGCRIADVTPSNAVQETIGGYTFPAGFGARVLIDNGKITNVYGGNDIAGNVYYGTNVIIRSSIIGDVYGGGNGSYAYTNKAENSASDYYFSASGTAVQVLDALNTFRPNSENVSIKILGTDKNNRTYIGGSVYCGGNSATLSSLSGSHDNARANLMVGHDVIANNVFLGSNGANMITPKVLSDIKNLVEATDGFDLTQTAQFDEYMQGVDVSIKPSVTVEEITDAANQSPTYIGSFFCGGNVGSMTGGGTFEIDFLNSVVIFDKLVAGCNSSNIARTQYNAYHMGGLTTYAATKVNLNLAGLVVEPRILTVNGDGTFNFDWNTYQTSELSGYLKGGNIYGGCYSSGYVNGNVNINITKDLVTDATKNWLDGNEYGWDDHCYEPLASTMTVFGGGYGEETEIWGNATINVTGQGRALKIRGGAEKGWIGRMQRSTDGNLVEGAKFSTFDGNDNAVQFSRYSVTLQGNATINMNADYLYDDAGVMLNNVGEICAGGQEGVVTGNTYLNLDQGSVYCAFGGASNSDIYGGTSVVIGKNGFPYVTETVYGGNDFGGQIMGYIDHPTKNTASGSIQTVRSNTYVEYHHGEIGYEKGKAVVETDGDKKADYGIFAGSFGKYDYNSSLYSGKAKSMPNMMSHISLTAGQEAAGYHAANAFLNISSNSGSANDRIFRAYGGSEGNPGRQDVANIYRSYVLLNGLNPDGRSGKNLAEYVYGAGDCSKTYYSRVDAYKASAQAVFAGCRGLGNTRRSSFGAANVTYMPVNSVINVYSGLNAPEMDIYGAGAYSGSQVAQANLYGGTVNNVYGSQINEGITYLAKVDVPAGSTIRANALFGGGKGNSKANACDTYIANVEYNSGQARINEAIYGGNHNYRFTRNVFLNINAPVLNFEDQPVDVYGAGYGANTVVTNTVVNMNSGSQAMNVFGGGRDGLVYDASASGSYICSYDYNKSGYSNAYEASLFNSWKNSSTETVDGTQVKNLGIRNLGAQDSQSDNAVVNLSAGAVIDKNVYGAGFGSTATMQGKPVINLEGATVSGDIYGGGYGGNVVGDVHVNLVGGTAVNAYGGGFEGSVEGNTYVELGIEGYDRVDGVLKSKSGYSSLSFSNGDPAIQRSLFGGGEKGAVAGNSYVTLYNGHIGYKYDTALGDYVANVDYEEEGDEKLLQNGNVFGGGYGEGATVVNTNVLMYGGTVRNGLYGGGEIASVGSGSVLEGSGGKNRILDRTKPLSPGSTHVTMYKGHVVGDVFGGGRGFSYDLSGNEVIGYKFYTDGYVFGPTAVDIFGGEIGTDDNVADEHGNVFGGGNVGFVYSIEGTKKLGTDNEGRATNYYYRNVSGQDKLTEDVRVLISPAAQVKKGSSVTLDGTTYSEYEFVPTEKLNLLQKNAPEWDRMDMQTGVTVHNAVFAGGNVSQGSDKLYANTTTVYGNATATLFDIYHHDLITVGDEMVGGLYGDGNLTLVDGYRELSISNYGTDYYGLQSEIEYDQYLALNDRERAYFELKFKCINGNDKYVLGTVISEAEYNKLPESDKANWQQNGFCSIYAGRLLNTIQRADFAGVFGSRIVLEGAQDRVVDVVDYTEYAINRIGELSLNRMESQAGDTDSEHKVHGNYFGLYNIVNYLEAMSSDVDFYKTVRTTDNAEHKSEGGTTYGVSTYYEYKRANLGKKYGNNGTTINKVALAKGVYLELSRINAAGKKEYGPVTGVFELDLMDVNEELGGAYVYAKNNHYLRNSESSMDYKTILAAKNQGARTYNGVTYSTTQKDSLQTSGNFVNKLKQIYDECYPDNGDDNAEAHYWFVRGSIYQYDQYVSAYTGSSTAYIADVQIPLTISSGSHGQLKIQSIRPNLYAYYSDGVSKLGNGETKRIGTTTYALNDIISYWDWSQLGAAEQACFVPETYIAIQDFKLVPEGAAEKQISSGSVLLPSDLDFSSGAKYYRKNQGMWVLASNSKDVVRPSNAMSHSTGYALTADITNPIEWDDLYRDKTANYAVVDRRTHDEAIEADAEKKKDYVDAPTYRLKDGESDGVYGQRTYNENDILTAQIVGGYKSIEENITDKSNQATVEKAYVSTQAVSYSYGGTVKNIQQEGVAISETEYTNIPAQAKASFEKAYVCTSTIDDGDDFFLSGQVIGQTEFERLQESYGALLSEAWICSKSGKYGGTHFETGKYYGTLETLCSLSEADRAHFEFNWDALDLFITDFTDHDIASYSKNNGMRYYGYKEIEYEAKYIGETAQTLNGIALEPGSVYTKAQYEKIPNEKCHYKDIEVSGSAMYIVMSEFVLGETVYMAGKHIASSTYASLDASQKAKVGLYNFTGEQIGQTIFFCKESYEVGENTKGQAVTDIGGSTSYGIGQTVPVGAIITKANYDQLPNDQILFTIAGRSPIETSTLYVSREADIRDVTKDRIVTLIYQYQYDENTEDGSQVERISERHVVNIHIAFKTGVPEIGELKYPGVIFPGATMGLRQPSVSEGAYEILGGGWEIYEDEEDAKTHTNGIEYVNNKTRMYYYQDGYYTAYYTKTYLGKTYSNAVPLVVANYHKMEDVMNSWHEEQYITTDAGGQPITDSIGNPVMATRMVQDFMFLNEAAAKHQDNPEFRRPKVYIDNHTCAQPDSTELDYLAEFFKESYLPGTENRADLSKVQGGKDVDFIFMGDASPKAVSTWTPLGSSSEPFQGDVHGFGHTVSGITNSLFGYMTGNIWNLGVTGPFTGSGLADSGTGKATNCWIWSSAQNVDGNVYAVMGNNNLFNCYYPQQNAYKSGNATSRPANDFYNGYVAYNLNDYYLNKRYQDAQTLTSGLKYGYWSDNGAGKLVLHQTAYYTTGTDNYVETLYSDPDYTYSSGTNKSSIDPRLYVGESYYPIYPDDYIFFGQKLTFDIVHGAGQYSKLPQAISKNSTNRRLVTDNTALNRVFRAPGYYGSSTMGQVFFNKQAAFDGMAGGNPVYSGLTAVDFTGYNASAKGDKTDWKNRAGGYTPVLDFDGLAGFTVDSITNNLLVYADPADAATYQALESALGEPEYVEGDTYSNVGAVTNSPKGLLVDKSSNTFVATHNHFLTDGQDFNAPIQYKFTSGHFMWYQRVPSVYGSLSSDGKSTGWETICLPFTAQLASAQDKGILTHFYNSGKESHEYWLRGMRGLTVDGQTAQARFLAPVVDNSQAQGYDSRYAKVASYTVNNTFLDDYYYNGKDKNSDDNQSAYNEATRTYQNYPYLTANIPYIISFPGPDFYEFDLSGEYEYKNAYNKVDKLQKQTISFVSVDGQTIGVTDAANALTTVMASGKTLDYMGSYSNADLAAGNYVMKSDGSRFDRLQAAGPVKPFRAYLSLTGSSHSAPAFVQIEGGETEIFNADLSGLLEITGANRKIIITSHLDESCTLSVVGLSGQRVGVLTVQPGETRTVSVGTSGLYMVNNIKVMVK